jgi:hypothetical protein
MNIQPWINNSFLKSVTPLSNNIDVNEISSHIETAQLINIREILGKLLYDDLNTKILANTLDSQETELYDILKYAIAYRASEIAIPFLSIKLRSKGAVRLQDETAQPASLEELKYLRHELKNKAEYFEQRSKDFLYQYSPDFPLWLSYSAGQQQIYPNTDTSYDSDIYLDEEEYDRMKWNRYVYGNNKNNF